MCYFVTIISLFSQFVKEFFENLYHFGKKPLTTAIFSHIMVMRLLLDANTETVNINGGYYHGLKR